MHSVTSILLVTKARHAAAEATAAAVSQWLEAHGVACSALPADCPSEKLVGRARTSDAIMITRTCLLLAWELLRGGTPIASGHAANDVVVGRGAIARVLPVHVFVDGEDMGVVRSDGVIVSTPLGSSAYALSAHGPLVHPKVQALTLTPISPFFKSFPPIVLPADSRIRLETDAAAPDAFLTVDGQEGIPLCGGDVIRVQSLDAGLRVLSCSSGTYFQRLRERGFIQTDGTSAPEHV